MEAHRVAAVSILCLTLCGCDPFGLSGSSGGENSDHHVTALVAKKGTPTKVDWFYSLNLDCSERPGVSGRLTTEAQHGSAMVEHKKDYPKFEDSDPHSRCNGKLTPAWVITYVPAADYVGSDQFSYDQTFPTGQTYHVDVNVDVQ
jgi:hypothetical protein